MLSVIYSYLLTIHRIFAVSVGVLSRDAFSFLAPILESFLDMEVHVLID